MAPESTAQGVGQELVDVLIVTGVKEEHDALLEVDIGAWPGSRWEVRPGPLGLDVAFRDFKAADGSPMRVAATRALEMGGVATANAAAPLVQAYAPRCLAMCGVCAGRRGDVELGDVIIADRLWTYDTGKLKVETGAEEQRVERVQGDVLTYNLNAIWKQKAERFMPEAGAHWLSLRPRPYEAQIDWLLECLILGEDPGQHPDRTSKCADYSKLVMQLWEKKWLEDGALSLAELGRRHIERQRRIHPEKLPEQKPFKVHVGPIGTGSRVVQDPQIFDKLSDTMRKVLGLEMEASAIGAIAHLAQVPYMIVMKGVMDFADPAKSDNFKLFAARASVECLIAFLRENLQPSRVGGDVDRGAPAQSALVRRLVELGFVAELARVFDTQDAAHYLLNRAILPVSKLRPFHSMPPLMYWNHVCEELASGRVTNGIDALVRAALKEYPGNRVFQAAAEAARA
jgi:nucleoside phosphorylase